MSLLSAGGWDRDLLRFLLTRIILWFYDSKKKVWTTTRLRLKDQINLFFSGLQKIVNSEFLRTFSNMPWLTEIIFFFFYTPSTVTFSSFWTASRRAMETRLQCILKQLTCKSILYCWVLWSELNRDNLKKHTTGKGEWSTCISQCYLNLKWYFFFLCHEVVPFKKTLSFLKSQKYAWIFLVL